MNLVTEDDFRDLQNDRDKYTLIRYRDGSRSIIPRRFFLKNWQDEEANFGTLHIGRAVNIGIGSTVKVDSENQGLRIGRFVAAGERVRFVLNAQHSINSIAMFNMACLGPGFRDAPIGQYGDTVLGNDLWIGDEAMFLGGCHIADGCVIGARALVPANFKTEPYGIYVGSPARLVRFRFPEKVRELLLALAWWEQPLAWIKAHMDGFGIDLTADEARSCELLREMRATLPANPEAAIA